MSNTPDLMFFWYILIIKSRINKQESDKYNSILRTRLEVIVQGALSH